MTLGGSADQGAEQQQTLHAGRQHAVPVAHGPRTVPMQLRRLLHSRAAHVRHVPQQTALLCAQTGFGQGAADAFEGGGGGRKGQASRQGGRHERVRGPWAGHAGQDRQAGRQAQAGTHLFAAQPLLKHAHPAARRGPAGRQVCAAVPRAAGARLLLRRQRRRAQVEQKCQALGGSRGCW